MRSVAPRPRSGTGVGASERVAASMLRFSEGQLTSADFRDRAVISGRSTFVVMVKGAHLREGSDPAGFRCLGGPRFSRVLVQGEGPGVVINATNDFAW